MASEVDGIQVLCDLVRPGLRLVVCGTVAGKVSAGVGAYYAGPGNKFWSTLQKIGLTGDRTLAPSEFRDLLSFGIGLTDLAKDVAGNDAELPRGCFDPLRLRTTIERVAPRALAFNGKKAASAFYRRRTSQLAYGRQVEQIGHTRVYVLPSTSGAANGAWSIDPWIALARDL
jgi:double-stranded uracil-DNA glycosylase